MNTYITLRVKNVLVDKDYDLVSIVAVQRYNVLFNSEYRQIEYCLTCLYFTFLF